MNAVVGEAGMAAVSEHFEPSKIASHLWRPIESAPKDGASILLAGPFAEPAGKYWYLVGSWSEDYCEWTYGCRPSHWMPLPAPPSDGVG